MPNQTTRLDQEGSKPAGETDSAQSTSAETARKLRSFALVTAACLSVFLPAGPWILITVPLLVYSRPKRRCTRPAFLAILLISASKALGIATLLWHIQSLPLKVASQEEFSLSFPPFSHLAMPDIGALELNVRTRNLLVADPQRDFVSASWWTKPAFNGDLDYSKIDPFTGLAYRGPLGSEYSVGPDLIDQGASLRYDPTNGTFSPGDILRKTKTQKLQPVPSLLDGGE